MPCHAKGFEADMSAHMTRNGACHVSDKPAIHIAFAKFSPNSAGNDCTCGLKTVFG